LSSFKKNSLQDRNDAHSDFQGIQWTRQSVRQYDGKIVRHLDPMEREHYWFTVIPIQQSDKGTDRWAIENGWTSITPLRLDLTDYSELAIIGSEVVT
jgi:5'-nucleotidase